MQRTWQKTRAFLARRAAVLMACVLVASARTAAAGAQTAGSTMGPWSSPSANLRFNDFWGAGGSVDRYQQRLLHSGGGGDVVSGRAIDSVRLPPSAASLLHRKRTAARGRTLIKQGKATTLAPLTSSAASLALVERTLIKASAQQRSAWPGYIKRYKELAPYWGYNTNDVADGAATCATSLYRLWLSDAASVQIGQTQGRQFIVVLRARLRAALLQNPVFQGMSAREKEAVHHYFAILTFAMQDEYDRAKKRGGDAGYIANVGIGFFRDITDLDPNRIQFTRSGLRLGAAQAPRRIGPTNAAPTRRGASNRLHPRLVQRFTVGQMFLGSAATSALHI